MPTDSSLRALRDANPRKQPGCEDAIARYGALRDRITASPVPTRRTFPHLASRRRLIGLSTAAAVALGAAIAGVTLSATSPPSAFAAAKKALAATAAAVSGTMTMTATGPDGSTVTLESTRWNGNDIAMSSARVNHILGPNRQLRIVAGGAYVETPDGGWLHYARDDNVGPKLGPAVQLAHDNVVGNTAQQILELTTGLRKAAQPGGSTVYNGTIPNSTADPARNPASDALMRMVTDLRTGYNPGAPNGSHNHSYNDDLELEMTVASSGLVRQIRLTLVTHGTGSSARTGSTTWRVTYSRLGSTPPITAPADSTPITPAAWSPWPPPANGPRGG
jgi:hypothetical protein